MSQRLLQPPKLVSLFELRNWRGVLCSTCWGGSPCQICALPGARVAVPALRGLSPDSPGLLHVSPGAPPPPRLPSMVAPPRRDSRVPSGGHEQIGQLLFTGAHCFSFQTLSCSHSAPFHTCRHPKKLSLFTRNSNVKETQAPSKEEVVTIQDRLAKEQKTKSVKANPVTNAVLFRVSHRLRKHLETQMSAGDLQVGAVSVADQAPGSREPGGLCPA